MGAKDLPAEPSEEDFRLGLRSGIILCNVLNKMQPGAVSKVKYNPKHFRPPTPVQPINQMSKPQNSCGRLYESFVSFSSIDLQPRKSS